MRADQRAVILLAIATARTWLAEMQTKTAQSVDALASREGRSARSIQMTLSLAFLAPDIVQAAVDGTLPRSIGVSQLYELPGDWTQQRAMLGLTAA